MKKWNVNTASIIGRDHELSKKNRQDFILTYVSDEKIIGVVCDGCGDGESLYSEVGASLLGTFIINYFKQISNTFSIIYSFALEIGKRLSDFIDSLNIIILNNNQLSQVNFIKDFMLSTNLFCLIVNEQILIGYCGDGIIIVDDKIEILDQKGSPHYIAYKCIPKEILEKQPTELSFFKFRIYKQEDVKKIVIATDGLIPIIDKSLVNNLYGTQKRQLQRKFNLWQQQKLFCDDATCIVIERQDENSNIQTTTNPT